jgi:hypothetical protein
MSARLPSWFWLLVCIASFAGSVLAWSLERRSRTAASAEHAMSRETPADAADSGAPPLADALAGRSERPAEAAASQHSGPAVFTAPPTADTAAGTRVLRCVVRGRVTYIDAASACPDGSAGKITVLPN